MSYDVVDKPTFCQSKRSQFSIAMADSALQRRHCIAGCTPDSSRLELTPQVYSERCAAFEHAAKHVVGMHAPLMLYHIVFSYF